MQEQRQQGLPQRHTLGYSVRVGSKKSELPMSRFIPLDNGSCWAQCFRHDVGSFFLANLAFPSQALSSLLVGSGFRGRVGPY